MVKSGKKWEKVGKSGGKWGKVEKSGETWGKVAKNDFRASPNLAH